jgi:hypothetical protein
MSSFRPARRTERPCRSLLAATCFAITMAVPSVALSAGYTIVGPLKGECRPDLPPCTPFTLFGPPNISGDYVVFTSRVGPADGIWSYRISKKKLTKLAGFETKVPDGKGRFTVFGSAESEFPTTVGGNRVLFFGRDANNALGIYTVPVGGGAISRIASVKVKAPGVGEKFNDLRFGALNGTTVAFWGNTPSYVQGIYRADGDGQNLEMVVNSTEPLTARSRQGPVEGYFGLFTRPTVGKTYVQFYASGLFDPVSGANAIFRAKGGFVDIADNLTHLENGTPDAHVRVGVMSAAVGSGAAAFHADEPTTGYAGLFKAKNMDEATVFVSTKTNAPGSKNKFLTFTGFGYDDSGLAFTATYEKGGNINQSVYFIRKPGDVPVRIASSDKYYLPYVGDRSISNGVIVFLEGTNWNDTFYIATPKE